MQTTGSRPRMQFPPGVLRLLVGATVVFAVLAILAGSGNMITGKAEAGVAAKVTVNTTGNTDDGDCEGPPNDNVIGGDCTLHEAIDAVNVGIADLINFHPAVFAENDPGTIIIDGEDGAWGPPDGIPNNLGCLPAIQRDGVTIDATGAGVIIDGDDDDDPSAETGGSPEECVAAILVELTQNGFDFDLIGNGNFTIKQFDADGVQIDGGTVACLDIIFGGFNCSIGQVNISGVTIEQIGTDEQNTDGNTESLIQNVDDNTDGGGGDGIDIEFVTAANEIHINDNIIDTEYNDFCGGASGAGGEFGCDGEEAVNIDIDRNDDANDGIFDDNILIDISGNSLNAEEEAIDIDITGDLGNPFSGDLNAVTVQINENPKLASDHEQAVSFDWNGCIFKSPLVVEVNGNENITGNTGGGEDAVTIDVDANADEDDCKDLDEPEPVQGAAGDPPTPFGSEAAKITISVNDNGSIGAPSGDEGVDINVDVCCGSTDGHSKHVILIHVDRNDDIRGDDHGVEIDVVACCTDSNSSTITVNENDEITGQNSTAVDIENQAGAFVFNDFPPSGDGGDADKNIADPGERQRPHHWQR